MELIRADKTLGNENERDVSWIQARGKGRHVGLGMLNAGER